MKKRVFGLVIAMLFLCTLLIGTVQVYAGFSPYQEMMFAEPDDYEQEIGNEFHQDVLKFEGNLGGTFDGAWLEYDGLSFGGVGAVAIKVNYCTNSGRCAADSQIEVWIDGMSTADGGTKVGTVDLPVTGSNWDTYVDTEVALDTVVTGDHDVYMVLVGTTSTSTPFIANLMSFEFVRGEGEEPTVEPTETPEETQAPTDEPTATVKPTTAAPKATTPAVSASASATQSGSTETPQGDSSLTIVIIVVAVIVIAAAVVAFIVLKKKKG